MPENPDLSECLRRAVESRPEMLQAKINLEKQHLAITYTRNQLYPELDLKASYGFNSGGAMFGQTLGHAPPGHRSLLFLWRHPHHPPGKHRRPQRLQVGQGEPGAIAPASSRKSKPPSSWPWTTTSKPSDPICCAWTRPARRANTPRTRYRRGNIRLQAGSTTSFEVLQLQNNLTTARSAEIRALADYNIALEQLALDEGTTLERSKIDLKMP